MTRGPAPCLKQARGGDRRGAVDASPATSDRASNGICRSLAFRSSAVDEFGPTIVCATYSPRLTTKRRRHADHQRLRAEVANDGCQVCTRSE